MKVHLRKTYLLEFLKYDDYIQFSIELKNKKFHKVLTQSIIYKKQCYCICKIPTNNELMLPHVEEYCSIKQINIFEEAYLKEYGKIIKP